MSKDASSTLLNSGQVIAELGGISSVTLWRWIRDGVIPPPIVINRRNYWPRHQIEAMKTGDAA